MNAPVHPLRSEGSSAPSHPKVFVRAIDVPAGLPWEQSKAAALEARHGAPLPISDVIHRVRRIGKWTPGRPGRFGAFYIRAAEFSGGFSTQVEIDGEAVEVTFTSRADQMRAARRMALIAGVGVCCGLAMAGAVAAAFSMRLRGEADLRALETISSAKLRAAKVRHRQALAAARLEEASAGLTPLSAAIGDLAWVAGARTPEAKILSVHWEHGLLAVEARGDNPPVSGIDRRVERFDKPVSRGVWLWSVAPQPAATVVDATPLDEGAR